MQFLLAIVIGSLYAMGMYLVLRRSFVKLILGLVLLSQASNLLIFTAAGLTRSSIPFIKEGEQILTAPYADPLPQALILTAIVISFGVLAFALVLLKRTYNIMGTDDLDQMRSTDQ